MGCGSDTTIEPTGSGPFDDAINNKAVVVVVVVVHKPLIRRFDSRRGEGFRRFLIRNRLIPFPRVHLLYSSYAILYLRNN